VGWGVWAKAEVVKRRRRRRRRVWAIRCALTPRPLPEGEGVLEATLRVAA
jgi:hypothetical protein